MPVEAGDILDGRYLLKAMIAEGGMGTVYAGAHTRLGRDIAVKILKPKHIQDIEQSTRFLQEAKAAAELHHRNIVDVIDIGTTPDGSPFFVMELLIGESLRERMKRCLPMQPREIGGILKQVLAGLGAAHSRGIVHRDVKPTNIFVAREIDGREIVKILDFGISKLQKTLDDSSMAQELTEQGTVLGTPLYMSPEQAAGKKELVDHRTDLYACGVVLYKALTGFHPYKGRNYNEIMHSIFTTTPADPSRINPSISPEMEAVIKKAMAKEADERFQTADEFAAEMSTFMVETTQTGIVLPREPQAEQKADTVTATAPAVERTDEQGGTPHTPHTPHSGRGATPLPDHRPVTPVSATSLTGKGAWEELSDPLRGTRDAAIRKRRASWLLLVPFVVLLLVVGGVLLIVLGRVYPPERGARAGIAATPAAPAKAVAGPAGGAGEEAPRDASITLTLTGLPVGAGVFVDDEPRDGNPVRIDRAIVPVKVRVTADGFEPFETLIVPSADLTLPVEMTPRPVPPPPRPKGKKKSVKEKLDLLTDFPE